MGRICEKKPGSSSPESNVAGWVGALRERVGFGVPNRMELVDEISELVYVCDLNTYDLLYINEAGKKNFGVADWQGRKCYEVLQGKDAPCEFCNNHLLNHEEFYLWEFYNSMVKGHFLLKDKLIWYQGREARVELAFDVSKQAEERIALQYSMDAEKEMLQCVRILYGTNDVRSALEKVLARIGGFLAAERAYLFEVVGGEMNNTFEWCAKGVNPSLGKLQHMPVKLIQRWLPRFRLHQCMVIEDVEALKETEPEEYEVLKAQGIERLVTTPIEFEGELVGFVGVDNPPTERIRNIVSLLDTLGYFVELSVRRQQDRILLERLSYEDTLTGAMNRNAFMRDIRRDKLCAGEDTGVIYLDINGMKEINDEYGHLYGDRYLTDVVHRIRAVFPEQGVYRVGGDEFILLCGGMAEEEFNRKVRELKQIFSSRECSVSVGCQWAHQCSDIQKLIFEADEIMYMDKKDFYRGRAFSRRYRHGNDDVLGLTRPGALEQAISAGQFSIRLQPKMAVGGDRLIGAEALVRYRDSENNVVPPDQFIPVLEEARMIGTVDFYVFEETCRRIQDWLKQGKRAVPLSTNFSRHTLSEKNFAEKIRKIWEKYGFPKQYIQLEITESVEEEDSYLFLDVMERIRAEGFSVSIDDFGVKHANLSLFTACDFDELKIDRSLVIDLAENDKARAILYSVSDICRRIGVQLIAEGVETEGQLRILQGMKCDGVQGFLFSCPLPVEEFEEKYLRT